LKLRIEEDEHEDGSGHLYLSEKYGAPIEVPDEDAEWIVEALAKYRQAQDYLRPLWAIHKAEQYRLAAENRRRRREYQTQLERDVEEATRRASRALAEKMFNQED
jgi:hypothetical protein